MKQVFAGLILITLLAGCAVSFPNQQVANQGALQATATRDLAGLYDEMGAVCLAWAQGATPNDQPLLNAGFERTRRGYERTWVLDGLDTGIRLSQSDRGFFPPPPGCRAELGFSGSHNASPLASVEPLQAGLMAYLRTQGFSISTPKPRTFAIRDSDGDVVQEFQISSGGDTQVATRGDLRLRTSRRTTNGVQSLALYVDE